MIAREMFLIFPDPELAQTMVTLDLTEEVDGLLLEAWPEDAYPPMAGAQSTATSLARYPRVMLILEKGTGNFAGAIYLMQSALGQLMRQDPVQGMQVGQRLPGISGMLAPPATNAVIMFPDPSVERGYDIVRLDAFPGVPSRREFISLALGAARDWLGLVTDRPQPAAHDWRTGQPVAL